MLKRRGARCAGAIVVGLLMMTALSGEIRAQGLKFSGYGDLEWNLQQVDNNPNQSNHHFFDNHHFNFVAVAWIIDDLVAAAEVEYEHAGEEIALEYAYIGYTGIRNVRLVGGKFIIPFARFNKDLHPSIINKIPGRPLPNNRIFPSTYSDVGLWVTGGIPLGPSGARVAYDAYVVNGLKGAPDESNWRSLRGNDREKPDQENGKSFGGRLGIELPAGLGIGVSGYTGQYSTDTLTSNKLDIMFVGGDVDYHLKGLTLNGEVVYGKQDLSSGDTDDRTGFYAQGAYLLSNLQNAIANFEPVVRYSWLNREGEANDSQELGLGLNYYVSVSSSLRLAYYLVFEDPSVDNNRLTFQFNVLF